MADMVEEDEKGRQDREKSKSVWRCQALQLLSASRFGGGTEAETGAVKFRLSWKEQQQVSTHRLIVDQHISLWNTSRLWNICRPRGFLEVVLLKELKAN